MNIPYSIYAVRSPCKLKIDFMLVARRFAQEQSPQNHTAEPGESRSLSIGV